MKSASSAAVRFLATARHHVPCWFTVAAVLTGCSHDCLSLPCPMPFAINLSVVSSGTHAPISTATVGVSGAMVTNVPCDSACVIPGNPGTYILDVEAPGYQAVERTVKVAGSTPDCGCASTELQSVVVALTPAE